MKAIQFSSCGSPDILSLTEVPCPEPRSGQVRVDLKAVAVLPVDFKLRRGSLKSFFDVPLPKVPGRDGVGIVGTIGPDVDYALVGDRVGVVVGHHQQGI